MKFQQLGEYTFVVRRIDKSKDLLLLLVYLSDIVVFAYSVILNKVTGREELCLNRSKASLLSDLQHSFLIRSSTSGVKGDVV